MTLTSTLGNVYRFNGSLLQLQTGGLLNFSLVNAAEGGHVAQFFDNDGTLRQSNNRVTTVRIDSGPEQPVDYLGAGTVSTLSLLGIPLFPHPMMAFAVDDGIYLYFPSGLPPLSGLLVNFDIRPGQAFALPNPMPICLADGSRVLTPAGVVPVENLRPGDPVVTLDHGPLPLRWIGRRAVSIAEQRVEPRLRGVRIAAGALGGGLPHRDLVVTRQHRLLVRDDAGREQLVAARHLVGGPGITQAEPARRPIYHHLLFDHHALIRAEGAATESLYLGPQALRALPAAARGEIALLFPDLTAAGPPPATRPFMTGAVARHLRAGRPADCRRYCRGAGLAAPIDSAE